MRSTIAAAVFFFASVGILAAQKSTVRYDGLYVSREGRYHAYLRFYPDGGVASAVSEASPTQAARWLRKGFNYFEYGTYHLHGDRIAMDTQVHGYGTVKWTGRVDPQKLVVSAYSRITRRREIREYQFVPVMFRYRTGLTMRWSERLAALVPFSR